ncbi:hypothetical protein [Streptomyces sp. NPDC006012]|uniref:hypothetical protein n=1 Tax=Streptomyces sp. NPDC006012 TaxID=3364739 RepID=UPI0036999B6A
MHQQAATVCRTRTPRKKVMVVAGFRSTVRTRRVVALAVAAGVLSLGSVATATAATTSTAKDSATHAGSVVRAAKHGRPADDDTCVPGIPIPSVPGVPVGVTLPSVPTVPAVPVEGVPTVPAIPDGGVPTVPTIPAGGHGCDTVVPGTPALPEKTGH